MRTVVLDLECVGLDSAGEYLEPVQAPANYKDPEKIAAYLEEKRAEQLQRCALDPHLARIVAIGWQDQDGSGIYIPETEPSEAFMLGLFWDKHRDAKFVGFNILGFDLPMLMVRSWYLGVSCPVLNLDRYRSPHIDLMQRLSFNGAIKTHSLRFYAKRFGLQVDDPVTGDQIPALVKAGEWDKVRAHCESDVKLTYQLAQRLGVIPTETRAMEPVL